MIIISVAEANNLFHQGNIIYWSSFLKKGKPFMSISKRNGNNPPGIRGDEKLFWARKSRIEDIFYEQTI